MDYSFLFDADRNTLREHYTLENIQLILELDLPL